MGGFCSKLFRKATHWTLKALNNTIVLNTGNWTQASVSFLKNTSKIVLKKLHKEKDILIIDPCVQILYFFKILYFQNDLLLTFIYNSVVNMCGIFVDICWCAEEQNIWATSCACFQLRWMRCCCLTCQCSCYEQVSFSKFSYLFLIFFLKL